MPRGVNRALQVRAADRLRASLARDRLSGLPIIDALSEADQRELCEVGGGQLAAVAIRVECPGADADAATSSQCAGVMGEIGRILHPHLRRTDILGSLDAATLLVLAPGLDPVGGRSLTRRLSDVLGRWQVRQARLPDDVRQTGQALAAEAGQARRESPVQVKIGAAYRSAASRGDWSARGLASEAGRNFGPGCEPTCNLGQAVES